MKNFLFTNYVLATNKLQDTKLVKGTTELIRDATLVLTGLIAAVTTLLIIYNLFRLKFADDQDKPKFKKGWKNALIYGALATCASGIVAAVFAYFA